MKDNGFVEVVAPVARSVSSPEWIECYVLKDIDPKMCGTLVRDLNSVLPLRGGTNDDSSIIGDVSSSSENKFPSMNHLKRIRRRPATIDEIHNRTSISTLAEEDESMESAMRSDSGVEENSNACDDGHPAKKARKMKKNAKCKTKRECGDNSEPYSLDILVGSIVAVDHYLTSRSRSLLSETKTPLSLIFERHDYVQQSLPGRSARTRDELDMWNATMWPTLFFEEKTEKFKVEQLALTPDEVTMMLNIGMSEAVKDAIIGRRQWTDWSRRRLQVEQRDLIIDPILVCGAVVMNPVDGAIISRAADERRLQGISHDETNNEDALISIFPDEVSPLCTSILLAIQGVSRRERHAAQGCGMESEEFRKGQVSHLYHMKPTILSIMSK